MMNNLNQLKYYPNSTPLKLEEFNDNNNQGYSNFGKILIILSIFIITSSLLYLFSTIVTTNSLKTNSKASEISDNQFLLAKYSDALNYAPDNPDSVIATASAENNKVVILESGKEYPYEEITFTWPKPKTREPNTEIVRYYVYFGPNSTEIPFPTPGYEKSVTPKNDGKMVTTNSYKVKITERNKPYYLYIQSQSNSTPFTRNLGLERLGGINTLPAKKLFVYTLK